ncbi:MAG: DNA-directed RNA polymerase subunit alpha C-terminal domain-containing protein [Planctomycetia bacterium]|nr:DNA-directed RNA polymerase subunit alpha C-terminal domain-containing protein [Planctomycetia bacterium]
MGTRIPLDPTVRLQQERMEKMEMSLAEIGLSVRTTNCLDEHGVATVADLLRCSREELLGIPNFGEKTLDEVLNALEKLGFLREEKRGAGPAYDPAKVAKLEEEKQAKSHANKQ